MFLTVMLVMKSDRNRSYYNRVGELKLTQIYN